MQAFILELENRPGSFAEAAEKIAAKGVNILGFGLSTNGKGYVGVVGSDDMSTREALDEIRGKYREVQLLPVQLEHTPGQAAKFARKLADAGINIEFFAPTGQGVVVLGCDRIEEARRILGSQVTTSWGDLWPRAVAGATQQRTPVTASSR
jgi:hypothetical protein